MQGRENGDISSRLRAMHSMGGSATLPRKQMQEVSLFSQLPGTGSCLLHAEGQLCSTKSTYGFNMQLFCCFTMASCTTQETSPFDRPMSLPLADRDAPRGCRCYSRIRSQSRRPIPTTWQHSLTRTADSTVGETVRKFSRTASIPTPPKSTASQLVRIHMLMQAISHVRSQGIAWHGMASAIHRRPSMGSSPPIHTAISHRFKTMPVKTRPDVSLG